MNTPLPDWPAVMRAKTAAAYLDISQSAFLEHVAPALPKVRMSPGIVGYRRSDLDRWVITTGESPLSAPAAPDDPIAAERREIDAFLAAR